MVRCSNMPLFWLATAVSLVGSCDSHSSPAGVDEIVNSCDAVAMGEPFASDESWAKIIEAEAAGKLMMDDCKSPVLMTPAPGTVLDRNSAPMVSFAPTQPACGQASLPRGRGRTSACARSGSPGQWERVWRWLSPIGVAEAHCPAVDGPNYLFRIADAQDKTIYSAVLSVTGFKPKDELWRNAMGSRAGQTVRVTVQRAIFSRGGIIEGPFIQKMPATLTIAP